MLEQTCSEMIMIITDHMTIIMITSEGLLWVRSVIYQHRGGSRGSDPSFQGQMTTEGHLIVSFYFSDN